MSALDFILTEKSIIVATDTLTRDVDGGVFTFVTKVFPLPHLKSVICGTGSLDLLIDWFVFVQKQVIGKDIYIINKLAPVELSKIYSRYKDKLGSKNTSTIYHFGYSINEEKFVGFAYRSSNNFISEKLPYGTGLKPYGKEIEEFAIKQVNEKGIKGIIEIMKKQKNIDDNKELKESVGIGGAIHILLLTKEMQFIWECYTFSDYNDMFNEGIKNLQNNNGVIL